MASRIGRLLEKSIRTVVEEAVRRAVERVAPMLTNVTPSMVDEAATRDRSILDVLLLDIPFGYEYMAELEEARKKYGRLVKWAVNRAGLNAILDAATDSVIEEVRKTKPELAEALEKHRDWLRERVVGDVVRFLAGI